MPGRGAATAAFAVAVLVSLYVLFAPTTAGAPVFPYADKVVHLLLFALLAATARWRFGRSAAVVAAVVAYAALSEVVQAVALPTRSGDLADLVADVAGVALATVLADRARRPSSARS
ncbi:MAG: VanZ family protein [Actinomycetota bacterium]|nr:VanZ family protein [Actinomycetota bacterium]